MADDNDSSEKEKENINYVRKKNIIPGVDNDHLIIGLIGLLGAAVAAPHVKNMIDNVINQYRMNPAYQQQGGRPPNGMQQQPVYLPPETQQQQQAVPQEQEQQAQQAEALRQHEHALEEQKAYEAAVEKENVTGSQGIPMVPDRSTPVSKKQNKGSYEAGSNISGSYS